MRIESYGYSMPVHPGIDWCAAQRIVNAWGGSSEYPAFDTEPRCIGDRLTQYGFDDSMPAPDQPGVYAVVARVIGLDDDGFYSIGAEHILYIGCGKSISRRLSDHNHPYWKASARLRGVTTRHLVTTEYKVAEKSLIRALRPWWNIQHNG